MLQTGATSWSSHIRQMLAPVEFVRILHNEIGPGRGIFVLVLLWHCCGKALKRALWHVCAGPCGRFVVGLVLFVVGLVAPSRFSCGSTFGTQGVCILSTQEVGVV